MTNNSQCDSYNTWLVGCFHCFHSQCRLSVLHSLKHRNVFAAMSIGSTQSQAIADVLQQQRVVPDLLPAVPDTLQGHLIIAYPTHIVQYVLSRQLDAMLIR